MGPKASDRLVTTCRGCRRRKVGCDRSRPACRQCRAANIPCVYERQGSKSYQFIHETPSGSSSKEVNAVDDDEVEPASTLAVAGDRIAALESRVKNLSDMLNMLQQSSSGDTSPLPPATSERDGPIHSGMAGYLSRQGGGKVRYVNKSSWIAMCKEATEIDDILFSQNQVASSHDADISLADDDGESLELPSVAPTEELTTTTGPISDSRRSSVALASLWTQLPSRPICDGLLQWYFRGYHPLIPLVHVPSFWKEYGMFWATVKSQDRARTNLISFATLLLSLLYAGSVVGGDHHLHSLPTRAHLNTVTHLYRLTATALKLAKFPHSPTLDTLRAYLILQSIRMREEEPLSSIAFVGLSLRVANLLGLHKDPQHFPQIDQVEAEVRRRVWWQVVHIDVCVAVAAGLPPLIGLQSWDVQALSELNDELIGTPHGMQYEDDVRNGRRVPDAAADPSDTASVSMVSTGSILASSKYRFTVAQRRFLARLEAGSVVEEASEIHVRLDQLGEYLQNSIDRIPHPNMDNMPPARLESEYGSALILNKWARLLISTYIDQRFCLMHYSLLSVPNWQDWNGLHMKCCIPSTTASLKLTLTLLCRTMDATMSFLIKCAQLSTEVTYRRFQWSWPGNHQPLHALAVLLNEVLLTPDSLYVDKIGNVVDVIFALVNEREGLTGHADDGKEVGARVLVSGGSDVWKYLYRLRARAWRKKGWDPVVVVSRDDATRLCRDGFVDRARGSQPTTAAQHQMAADEQSSAGIPLMGLFGDDFLYPGDMELPDFNAEIGFLGGMEDFSLDNL